MDNLDEIKRAIDAAEPVPDTDAWPEGSAQKGSSIGGSPPKGGGGGDVDPAELAFLPLTDLGNAERFARRFRGRLLHVAALGWLVWDGRRWCRDGADDAVLKAAHATARAIQEEADAIRGTHLDQVIEEPTDKRDAVMLSDKLAKWGRATESATKLKAIPPNAAPYLAAAVEQLDADLWKLNVLNGTLVIDRTARDRDPVTLRPHDPRDLITKLAPVVYDPNATSPVYDAFLAAVQPDPEMRAFLHRWGGYSLTGDVGEQRLAFFFGKGKNGKSTLVDAWGAIAGDYGTVVPIESFVDQGRGRNAGAATPDLAVLPGVRFLRASEPEKGAKLAESLIKAATGGEPMLVRHLNRDYFTFRPAFKVTLQGNYRPKIAGTDNGIWRRIALVPWLVTVEKPDRELPARLAAESSGILNHLLDGLRSYLDDGMRWPGAVEEATEDYRTDSDPLGRFIADCIERKAGARTTSTALHTLYAAWCRATGEAAWTVKGLSMALKDRGFTLLRSGCSQWVDVRLTRSVLDFDEAPAPPDDDSGDP